MVDDPVRHQTAVEVKGATLTGVKVERGPDNIWRAEGVVDG